MTVDIHSPTHTHLEGYLHGPTYTDLVDIFGDPDPDLVDGDKTRAEWHIDTTDGLVTIYDYRAEETPLHEVTEWHLGGHNQASVTRVKDHVLVTGRMIQQNHHCIPTEEQ
jgi:hypothetical protein